MKLKYFKKYSKLGYDFNLQLFNGEFNLYIEKNGVDFNSFHGEYEDEVLKKAKDFFKRIGL